MKYKITALMLVAILLATTMLGTVSAASTPVTVKTEFSDIKGHWAEENIKKVIAAGLMRSRTQTAFEPQSYFTIDEAVQMMVRLANLTIRANKAWESEGIPYVEAGEKLSLLYPRNMLLYNSELWDEQIAGLSAEDFTYDEERKLYCIELAGLLNIGVNSTGYRQITKENNFEALEYFTAENCYDIRDGGLNSKISKGFLVEILATTIMYRDGELKSKEERIAEYQETMIQIVETETGRNRQQFTDEDKKMVDVGLLAYWPQAVYCIEKGYIMRQNTFEHLLVNVTRAEAATIMVNFLKL